MPACKPSHLLQPFDWDQGRQWLTLPLDDEFIMSEGDPIQHVSDSLPDVHRRNFFRH
jgi:hypothetical protein